MTVEIPTDVPALLVGEEGGDYPNGALRLVTFDPTTQLWTWSTWFHMNDTPWPEELGISDGWVPGGLVLGSDGAVYCSDYYNATIIKIHPSGALVSGNGRNFDLIAIAPSGNPAGIALDPTEQYLYVCMWSERYVARVTLADGTWEAWWAPGEVEFLTDQERSFESGSSLGRWQTLSATTPSVVTTVAAVGTHSLELTADPADITGVYTQSTDIPVADSSRAPRLQVKLRRSVGSSSGIFAYVQTYATNGSSATTLYNSGNVTLYDDHWVQIDSGEGGSQPSGYFYFYTIIQFFDTPGFSSLQPGDAVYLDDASVTQGTPQFTQPQGIVLGSDGELYLTDRSHNTVKHLLVDSHTIEDFAGTADPAAEFVNPVHRDGVLGVAKSRENFALCAGGDELFFSTLASSVRSVDLATGSMGTVLYSAELKSGTFDFIVPPPAPVSTVYSAVTLVGTTTFYSPFDWPNGITCTPDGSTVFISDFFANNVFAIDRDGQVEGLINEDDFNFENPVDGVEYRALTLFPTQAIAYIGSAPYNIRIGPGVGPGGTATAPRGSAVVGDASSRVIRSTQRVMRT